MAHIPYPSPLLHRSVRLAAEPDPAAEPAWLAHVDAGRVAAPAPAADLTAERGCASLEAILRRPNLIW